MIGGLVTRVTASASFLAASVSFPLIPAPAQLRPEVPTFPVDAGGMLLIRAQV